jgi:hypothetical protein
LCIWRGTGKTVSIIASVPPTDRGWLGVISKNAKAAADALVILRRTARR